MFKKIGIAAAGLVVFVLLAIWFADITPKDIAAANAFTSAPGAQPLSAGDVVVLKKGGGLAKLCDAIVDPSDIEMQDAADVYYNRASRYVHWAAAISSRFGLVDEDKISAVTELGGLPFVGGTSSLTRRVFEYNDQKNCECDTARSMSFGERVCVVSASLIETREMQVMQDGERITRPVRRALGVQLRRHPVFVPPETYESCNVPYTEAAKIAEQQLCEDDGWPSDVRVRRYFNLIDRRPLPQSISVPSDS
ncbi:hypothetical protein SAMN05421688_1200 [Poseidonocella pacifica]|uniref:Uncharacterized protein n=1 Tax=Poseidonocella pacifica TaxID=871651 RepID=A0A1I0WAM6_9RHOB|nr:hypothetical protein [Poseidonocella pacifica]SFA85654.1 hypothetical protein SAMN05421688_1200 [Poseidonocella pacifica]